MKTTLLTFLSLTVSAFSALAQSYNFTQSTATYTDLPAPTVISGTAIWDDTAAVVPIGFPFTFGGLTYSNIEITSNGVLLLNSGATDAAIVAYDADFASLGTATSTSPIGYQLTGAPGSQVFKVEWKNTGFYDGSGTDFTNVQVWIYEGSNKVETRIGNTGITNPLDIFGSFGGPANGIATSVDFVNETLTGYFLQGSPASATAMPLTNALVYPFLTAAPANGTVYTYSVKNLGVAENLQKNALTMFPNPATDQISFSGLKAKENVSVNVYDLLGKIVLQQETTGTGNLILNVASLPKGTYFVEVKTGTERAGKQLIKL